MDLRSLFKHTRLELLVMNKALERLQVFKAGIELERAQKDGVVKEISGENSTIMNRYLEERERFAKISTKPAEQERIADD